MGILTGVLEHFIWNGPNPPISKLVSFVDYYVAVFLQDVCQSNAHLLYFPSSLLGVEQVDNEHTEVSLQPFNISLASMKNFQDGSICANLVQPTYFLLQNYC